MGYRRSNVRIISVLIFVFITLGGCQQPDTKDVQNIYENSYIKVVIDEIVEVENGFFLTVTLESITEGGINKNDYAVAFPSQIILANGHEFYKINEEQKTEFVNDEKVMIREFYLSESENQKLAGFLSFSLYVKPTFNKKLVTFEIDGNRNNVMSDGIILTNIDLKDNYLRLNLNDVHPTKGIGVTIELEGERIYPVVSRTEQNLNTMKGEFEFAQPLPETISLMISRANLSETIWELPFTLEF